MVTSPRLPVLSVLIVSSLCSTDLISAELEVADGLSARPAVSPGLITHPLGATLDGDGHLYVATFAPPLSPSQGISDGETAPNSDPLSPLGRVQRLSDTDGDGVFDQAVLFAEGFAAPRGMAWVDDSLYLLAPPVLWKLPDSDRDGIADGRERIIEGFKTNRSLASKQGLVLHPNGRLYWTLSQDRFAIPDSDTGQIMESGTAARVWFSQITGGDLASYAGGGMDQPSGLDYTDEGELLGVVNFFHDRPRDDALVHWIFGGVYPRRDEPLALAEFPRTGDLLPAIDPIGAAETTALIRYRSGQLKESWTDHWIISHANQAKLTRTRLDREGATFSAAETETIFQISDSSAQLSGVIEDHNGDLLAIHCGSQAATTDFTSRNKETDRGMIYRLSRKGSVYFPPEYPDWGALNAEEIADFLSHETYWLRERAITELAVAGAPAIPELRRLLMQNHSSALARQSALWTLARMKFSESTDLIYEALQDPHPGVRQVACEAIAVTRTWQSVAANQPAEMEIELERNQTISGQLARIVRSDSPPVARSAAMALGRMGEFRAIGALLGRLGRLEQDRFLEHSLIYALIEIDDFESTHEALKSENPSIISGALWALEGMNSSQLEIFDVLPFLDEEDSQLRQTAIAIASQHPGWDAGIANTFFNWVEDLSETRQIALMEMIPQLTMTPPFADFLTSLANSDESGHRELALELITRSTATRLRGDWRSAIRSALKTDVDPTLRSLAIAALARFPESSFLPLLKTLQESDQVGAGERRMLEDLVERLESTPERTRALPIFKEPESP